MSDLDNAIKSINESAVKAENTAGFLDDMSTFDDQSTVTNPNNGQTVASIPKQVKDRTDELFAAAESDINQAVATTTQNAIEADQSASEAAQSANEAAATVETQIRERVGVYKIGNISDYAGQQLTEAEKENQYQYPDDSNEWYGPIQDQVFPITIPSDPSSDNAWALVNALSSDSLPLYAKISYKASAVNSPVENMKLGVPLKAKVGDVVSTSGYYNNGDRGDAFYILVSSSDFQGSPDGWGDHLDADGNVFKLISEPTSLRYGVKTNNTLIPLEAANNRAATESMLRQERFNSFELNNIGDVNILGSIHPLRSNIYVKHLKGCNVRGYLDDPSQVTVKAGHIFGFALYNDPEGGDYTITGPVENVVYKLDGDISSIYRAIHTNTHNNNCIGFADSIGCYVKGSGGVSESDHKGITFDSNAVDCHIDVGYIKQTSNSPCQMKGDESNKDCKNTVTVGRIENPKFDGGDAPVVCFLQFAESTVVKIGKYTGDKSHNPSLVGAFNCGMVEVNGGVVENLSQILRQYQTREGIVSKVQFRNADSIVRRAGTTPGFHKNTRILGNTCLGGSLNDVYRSDYNGSTFKTLEVRDNDFSDALGTVNLYSPSPIPSSGAPEFYEISGNDVPPGWDIPQAIPNKRAYFTPVSLSSQTTFQYDIAGQNSDIPYTRMEGRIVDQSFSYPFEFDLLLMYRTSFDHCVSVFHKDGQQMKITTSKTGQNVTFTLDGAGTGATFGEIIVTN
ncbi:putative phage tail protein [Vibrio phage 455E52-1]|nr:putative phage tail protein [Vibrio phage 455E52-1]